MSEDLYTVLELTLAKGARCYMKSVEVSVKFAVTDGSMMTLEGEVPYRAGDALMTGVQGESWPIERAKFDEWYRAVDGKPGYFLKVKSVLAQKFTCAFRVPITESQQTFLVGKAGDWVVQTSPGNLGVVDSEIFKRTYRLISCDSTTGNSV